MPSGLSWSLAILSNLIHLLLLAVMLYFCVQIYKFRRCQAVQKRYPFLVYVTSILFGFYLLQHVFYKFAVIYDVDDVDFQKTLSAAQVSDFISGIMYYFSLHGAVIMLNVRSWFIYFNTKYGIQVQRQKWSVLINAESVSQSAWFVRHRKDFGSPRLVYAVAMTFYLTEAILLQTASIANLAYLSYIDSLLYLVELISLTVIWNRIPQFYDVFGIKRELQLVVRLGLASLLVYVAYEVVSGVADLPLWLWMLVQLVIGAGVGVMAITLNAYVFREHKELLLQQIAAKKATGESMINTTPQLTLKNVLESTDYMELLFKQLSAEFSVELLLSLVEFKQFHDAMKNDAELMAGGSLQSTKYSRLLDGFDLCAETPQSSIVYAGRDGAANQIERYLLIAKDLCAKYVNYGSEYEINISYESREGILAFVAQYQYPNVKAIELGEQQDQCALFALFDKVSSEMYQLLKASHTRCMKLGKYDPSSE